MTLFHKQVFQKMNLDVDCRRLQPGEYRRLNNGIPIKGTLDAGQDGNILNLVGNALITNGSAASGTNTTIGFLEDKVGGRSFFFVHNTTAANNSIYQYVNGTITLVFRSALLAFSATDFVDADIVGDILIFTNNTSEIFKINVAKAIAGVTYTPTIDEITLIKRPPQLVLTGATSYDSGFVNNYIYDNYFQFYYRYIYEDNEFSVFSGVSDVVRPDLANTTHNRIQVTMSASEVIPSTVKQIDYAVRVNGSNELIVFKTDFPTGGTLSSRTFDFYNFGFFETVADSVSVKWNDSVPRKCKSLRIFKNRIFTLNNTEGYTFAPNPIANVSFASASGSSNGRSFKHRGIYDVGLMFFDNYGRHAGVQVGTVSRITIPDRTQADSQNRYSINFDLSTVSTAIIPSWATHYAIVRTKCKNISYFIQHTTADIFSYHKDVDGSYVFNHSNGDAEEGWAIDISALTKLNIGYTFTAGDRIRIYMDDAYSPYLKAKDLEIRSQDGRFVFVDHFFLQNQNSSAPNNYKYEIYRPKNDVEDVFYECGAKFKITAGAFSTLTGSIEGDGEKNIRVTYTYDTGGTYSYTDPYANSMESLGTAEFGMMNVYDRHFEIWVDSVGRSIARSNIGSVELSKTNYLRFSQTYNVFGINGLNTFEALDDYGLQVKNGPGVRLVDDGQVMVGIHEVGSGSIYVGEGFINTTDSNQFLAKTDSVIGDDKTYQDIHGSTFPKAVVAHNGRVYYPDINRGHIIRRAQDGLTRISNYGVRGLVADICRQTKESIILGHTPVIVAGWDSQYECYTITFKIPSSSYTNGITLYFHEDSNSWVCTASFAPELYGSFKDRQIHFLTGDLWLQNKNSLNTGYNNWFGVQYTRSFQWEIGSDSLEKIWENIEIDAETLYATTGVNEVIVSLYDTNGGTLMTTINYFDFKLRGSAYRSSFFRWINDVNFASTTESKYKSPHSIRGQSAFLNLTYNGTDRGPMKSITVGYRPSMNTNP